MKILLLNQFFWPDSSATSQLLTDLARGLSERGHEVFAIAADGGYAPSAFGEAPPDVTVYRVKALPFVRGRLGRVLSYLSFYVSATVRGLTVPRPDLVLTLTTPPLLSLLGTILKAVRGSRHFIWEMDVYPDVAVDLEYFRAGGLPDRLTGILADFSRRRSDGILSLGECMRERLIGRGIPAGKISVAENWADGNAIRPISQARSDGKLVLLYSGNLGLAHDLGTVTGAIEALSGDDRFRFLFAGSGGRRKELEEFCHAREIRSVEMRPYAQRASLSESLAAGDIGLVTQREICCGSVVPSKVYGLLAAGKPILFIGPENSTPAYIVKRFRCGWHISCGDVRSLVGLLQYLADHPEEVARAGASARETLLRHYDLDLGVGRICQLLGADAEVPPASGPRIANNTSSRGPEVLVRS